ncbi:hypothetical protein [Symmachiella macrocystis]|uniref:hypothetical protein n=1 Tax=Symmachiella macrocystis TaxID=2527985 RepID=UPI0018D470FD|nr:hypothetical protein [Symmachiella macrocystis]
MSKPLLLPKFFDSIAESHVVAFASIADAPLELYCSGTVWSTMGSFLRFEENVDGEWKRQQDG